MELLDYFAGKFIQPTIDEWHSLSESEKIDGAKVMVEKYGDDISLNDIISLCAYEQALSMIEAKKRIEKMLDNENQIQRNPN